MTNDEYKELASKIINELDDIEGQDLTITNIGELFIMRLHYALSMLNEQTPKIEIVKEIKNLDDNIEGVYLRQYPQHPKQNNTKQIGE